MKGQRNLFISLILIGLFLMTGAFAAGFVTAEVFWPNLHFSFPTQTTHATINTNNNAGQFNDDFGGGRGTVHALKPVIYLYPTTAVQATVQLNYDGTLTKSVPSYNSAISGWQVMAEPNGTLTTADGLKYPYLFWEGTPNDQTLYRNPTSGFVVTSASASTFLQTVLPKLGLESKEYKEFIAFWLPRLEANPYNLVHFADQDYQAQAQLMVTPQPDTTIRVFMVVQPITGPQAIPEQTITTPIRRGFTVVEWGGTILSKQ